MHQIVGKFESFEKAENVIRRLVGMSIPQERISLSRGGDNEFDRNPSPNSEAAMQVNGDVTGKTAGRMIGGTLGGIVGLIAGIATLAFVDFESMSVFGPLVTTFLGVALGIKFGEIAGRPADEPLLNKELNLYLHTTRDGEAIVSVETTEDDDDTVRDVMKQEADEVCWRGH